MNGSEVTTSEVRPLRADAARNRELILRTAAEVFAEHGIDAGYDEIARKAGVGVGTVYRRFPQRDELVRALFDSRIDEVVDLGALALKRQDPFEALAWFLEQTLARQEANQGLQEVMAQVISRDEHRALGRERLSPIVQELIARAQADGSLRDDVGPTDIGLQLMLLSSISVSAAPELWRRYLALLLEGLRARPDQAALPLPEPEDDALHELMCSMQRRAV